MDQNMCAVKMIRAVFLMLWRSGYLAEYSPNKIRVSCNELLRRIVRLIKKNNKFLFLSLMAGMNSFSRVRAGESAFVVVFYRLVADGLHVIYG